MSKIKETIDHNDQAQVQATIMEMEFFSNQINNNNQNSTNK